MADPQPSDRGLTPAAGPSVPDAPSAPGTLRASHADRDLVVEQLRVAAGDGRLSPEELDERLELALTARTYAELATLVADLPAAGTAVSPAPLSPTSLSPVVGPSAPKDLIRLHCSSGRAERRGRWVVPNRMDLKVSSGHITLDFTEAVIMQRMLHIDADVRSGHITLITKPGIVVDADDVTVRNGRVKVLAPWGTDVPELLRIDVTGKCGSGHINARPPRRSFWQWLRRAPRPYAIAA